MDKLKEFLSALWQDYGWFGIIGILFLLFGAYGLQTIFATSGGRSASRAKTPSELQGLGAKTQGFESRVEATSEQAFPTGEDDDVLNKMNILPELPGAFNQRRNPPAREGANRPAESVNLLGAESGKKQ